jgi:microcystin degradation protein MlrC
MTLKPLLWTFAMPGGTVVQAAYDHLKGLLLDRIRRAGPFDGLFLGLHGAMVTEAHEDAEGDLIAAAREAVGPRTPIVVTLDLHANLSSRMAEAADVLIGFDEYPHTDLHERGREAAEVLSRILSDGLRPCMAYRQLPLITMPPRQCTLIEPMRSLLAAAHEMERDPGVVNVTLAMGFPFADVRDAGASVTVTTDGDPDLARRRADEMAAAVWARREEFDAPLTPVAEAIRFAKDRAKGPVVLADGSDNPGGGGPCDGTVILRELLGSGLEGAVVAVIADPGAVTQATLAGVGNRVSLSLGGKTDDRHGPPVGMDAYVRLISDGEFIQQGPMGTGSRAHMGRTVVLVANGVEVVVTERRIQPYDASLLRSVGIEPAQRRLIALKSAVHFRGSYQGFADRIFDADTPGVHRPDFSCYEYRRVRRPIYPLDPVPSPEFRVLSPES